MKHIKTVIILVEMDDGKVRQVLASKDKKEDCLHYLADNDSLKLSDQVEQIEVVLPLQPKKSKA